MRNCLYEVTLIKDLDGHLDYLILAFVFLNKDKYVRVKRKKYKIELRGAGAELDNLNCV